MRRLLREPLLHFFLLGALLFGVYGWLNRGNFDDAGEIVVSRGQVSSLAAQFKRVWQREPNPQELQGLIDNWVREEVFYREGLAMGLDRDDPVVRRRVQQKVEFILDSAAPAAPTEAELKRWLEDHPDAFRRDPVYELRQVYFDPGRHGARLEKEIASVRRALASGIDVPGDSTLLPASLHAPSREVARVFGPQFEIALRDLPVGGWQGPIESPFGVHLVQIAAREPASLPPLVEVREAVERELMRERAEAAAAAVYERLRANYRVRIEAEAAVPPTG